jgi:TatD DNase family protein
MYIDTHLHLNSEKYPDSLEVIEKANLVGVSKFITIGTTYQEIPEILNLIKHPQVFGTLGIYPTYDNELSIEDLISYLTRNLNPKIVGIGECGFNQPIYPGERELIQQEELFRAQIELALSLNLPLVVHTRNSDKETLKVLESYKNKNLKGVIHCFVSEYEFAKKVLDLGFYLSFNGIITYKSGNSIYETIEKMPIDRILLETDAPYLSPEGFRDKFNEPKYLPIIAQKIAEIKKIDISLLKLEIYKNSLRLFDKITE